MYIRRPKIGCFRTIREASGLTGKDLAKMIHVSPSMVYSFENATRSPRGVATIKLAVLYSRIAQEVGMEDDLWEEVRQDARTYPTEV